MTFDDVEAYLARLTNALRRRGVSNLRMIEEARGHLADAADNGIRRGIDPHALSARHSPSSGLRNPWLRRLLPRRTGTADQLVLLAAAIMGMAIAYVDSRPAWDDTGFTAFALVHGRRGVRIRRTAKAMALGARCWHLDFRLCDVPDRSRPTQS